MKVMLILFVTILVKTTVLTAGTFTLKSTDGREMIVKENVRFDGKELTVTRAADQRTIRMRPDQLEPQNWVELNALMTDSLDVKVDAKTNPSVGNVDKFAAGTGFHQIEITSTSHFEKGIAIVVYNPGSPPRESRREQHVLSFEKPVQVETGGASSMIVVEHADASLAAVYARSRVDEAAVRRIYEKK